MFAEGSLFKTPIKGQIVDVTPAEFKPEHDVYRYGLAMTVAILSGIKS
jgi:CRISPR/Cas system CSM-associated protein Csm4 (group 5 of RAMP superfamily)